MNKFALILVWLACCVLAAELMGRAGDWARQAYGKKHVIAVTFGPEPPCHCSEIEARHVTREQLEQALRN